MRAFTVFVVTFILGMVILVSSFHAFSFERAGVIAIALWLVVLGLAFGAVAGWWQWAVRHPSAFLSANFAAGMTILLPFILVSYGGAIVLLPLVLEWVGMNFIGLTLTQRMRATKRR